MDVNALNNNKVEMGRTMVENEKFVKIKVIGKKYEIKCENLEDRKVKLVY